MIQGFKGRSSGTLNPCHKQDTPESLTYERQFTVLTDMQGTMAMGTAVHSVGTCCCLHLQE